MRIFLFLVFFFFSSTLLAANPPDAIPVYLTDGVLLSANDIYFIAVCLALLGAGWITFS